MWISHDYFYQCRIRILNFIVLANLGGTLGLCIGASLLTLLEFVDFIGLKIERLCWRRIENNNMIKEATDENEEKNNTDEST